MVIATSNNYEAAGVYPNVRLQFAVLILTKRVKILRNNNVVNTTFQSRSQLFLKFTNLFRLTY